MPLLEARLLGSPRLSVDGRPVVVSSRKALGLLCYLVAVRQIHSRERLAGLLWPDVPEQNALASLRTALHDIRHALGAGADGCLFVERTRIGIHPDARLDLDVAAVEAMAGIAGASDADVAAVQAAVAAYDGPFLDGFSLADAADFDDWVFLERERLTHLHLSALCLLAEHHARGERWSQAIELARRVLAVDPLREDVHRALMRYLALAGQRAAAIAQYQACAALLQREIGVAPLGATTTLFERIRACEVLGDDEVGPAPIARAAAARTAPAPDAVRTTAESRTVLVGRRAEIAALEADWALVRAGTGRLVVIDGEPGIGKSRLVAEVLARVGDGGAVLVGRCYEATTTEPYGPIVEVLRRAVAEVDLGRLGLPEVWVRELARLLPELEATLPTGGGAPLDGVRDRDRLFEGVRLFLASLAAQRPVVLVVEDLHWADETSLSLLGYVARSCQHTPLLVLATVRGDEIGTDRRTALRVLARHGRHLGLAPLSADECADLVACVTDARDRPERFSRRLHHTTGGNPFFLIETLRALIEQGSLQGDDAGWTTATASMRDDYAPLPVPESVGLIVAARLERLGDDARSLLDSAAVMRRDFEFDALQAVVRIPPTAALDALDELIAHGLVREAPPDGEALAPRYDFAHALVRDVVYGALTGARRQYLHRRVAGLLEVARPVAPDRIAYHYLRGGARDRACAWSLRAGDAALRVYAAEGALVHFRTARELAVEPGEQFPAIEGIGDAFVGLGRHAEAIRGFEAALPLAPDAEARADLYRRIGRAHERQGAYDRALDAYGEAQIALRHRPLSLASIRIADGLATVYVRLGRHAEAAELCRDGMRWLAEHPEIEAAREAEAWLRNTGGMALMHAGDFPGAIASLERSLALKRELGDQLGEATLLNNLGVVRYHRGDDELARAHYDASLAIKTAIGDSYGRSIALANLALIETHLGNFDGAHKHLVEAEAAAGAVGAAWLMPEIKRVAAQRALAVGDLESARRDAEGALAAAEDLGVPAFIGVAHRVMGLVKGRLPGEATEAREHFETSLAVFEMLENQHEMAKTHAAYGETLVALGQAADGETHLRAARDVFTRSGAHGRLRRLEPLIGR
jgi:DNA-binding SARP family transcriptional activator/tetratricopeptide (TPR) repeat protein